MRERSLCKTRVCSFAREINRCLSIFMNYTDEIKHCVLPVDMLSALGGFEMRTSQI
jgi:hypothetical protein